MHNRLTELDYHNLAKEKGIKWLGDKAPKNNRIKTKWLCVCSHIFEKSYEQIARKRKNSFKCVKCNKKERKTIKDYKELVKGTGIEPIEPIPSSVLKKATWKCDKGHIFEKRYSDMRYSKKCPICSSNSRYKRTNYNKEDYHNLAKEKGIKWVGKELPNNSKELTKWECKEGHTFSMRYNDIQQGRKCKYCHTLSGSNRQKEIFEYVYSLNSSFKSGVKFFVKGNYVFECDIYSEELKLGIEFNGNYWHSELYKKNNYHQHKMNFFKAKGIRLIQIFEHEWDNKQDIIKSIISNALHVNITKIYARKCSLKEVTTKEARKFIDENHIQGYIPSSIKLGLYHNKQLVSICTFGKSRFKKDEFELYRFCSLKGLNVVGGFSKILNHPLIRELDITTYCDLRFFNGNGYLKSGFIPLHITKPNYFYYNLNTYEILTRMRCQKHKLPKLLKVFDKNLTEVENMNNNKFYRIFDCGNLKLILIRKCNDYPVRE